ncbi:MAG: PEGA domain-containing protein [Candidatus Omnitrophica bacterium]|nr:PEGA domain-containing protein [Candidatus Omnitrophota bacterium]
MKSLIAIFLIVAITITHSGCASIFCGTSQQVSVTSDPDGAKIEIDGIKQGNAPMTMNLKRKKKHMIKATMEGYEDKIYFTEKEFNPVTLVNLLALWFFIVGIVIDGCTGAMYKFDPDNVVMILDPGDSTESGNNNRNRNNAYVEIEKLGDLKEKGLLTEEEFEKKKSELLQME